MDKEQKEKFDENCKKDFYVIFPYVDNSDDMQHVVGYTTSEAVVAIHLDGPSKVFRLEKGVMKEVKKVQIS